MFKVVLLITSLAISTPIYADVMAKIPSYDPISSYKPDLSPSTIKAMDRLSKLGNKYNLSKTENIEFIALCKKYGEVWDSAWDIVSGACSWYCGGGNYKVKASSFLKNQGPNVYSAKSANDLSYKTAWIEGVNGYGIGEYLEYFFKNDSPRITSIRIVNGYIKSDIAWKENSRVKKLKVYENNKPIAILKLRDFKGDQEFKIGTLGRKKDRQDLILKFEIIDVYKGTKFKDTVITEIYFDGIDVH